MLRFVLVVFVILPSSLRVRVRVRVRAARGPKQTNTSDRSDQIIVLYSVYRILVLYTV